tara:strand:+ start:1100 stop:1489 length:390 start_codon:yes stop_codon:yes gene_type:complete
MMVKFKSRIMADVKILDKEYNLTEDWKKLFKEYKRNSNYPTLQDISNLINKKVNDSQCGVALRCGSASLDTAIVVSEVAYYIGYISADWKKIIYRRLKKKHLNNKTIKLSDLRSNQSLYNKIIREANDG